MYEVFLIHQLFTPFYLIWNSNVQYLLVAFHPLVDAGKRRYVPAIALIENHALSQDLHARSAQYHMSHSGTLLPPI